MNTDKYDALRDETAAGAGSFAALGIAPYFIEALAGRFIAAPTPIQVLVCPRLLAGESLFFRSATGTGKTFAYLIPIFQRLLGPDGASRLTDGKAGGASRPTGGPRVLIAAPTYELCSQIKAEADFLLGGAVPAPLGTALLIGGGNLSRQIDGLKKDKPDVIIGNPGRILQIAQAGKLKLGRLEYLVLDEGDRLVADDLAGETGELLRFAAAARNSAGPGGGIERAHPVIISCSATLAAKSRDRIAELFGPAARPGASPAQAGPLDVPVVESEDRAVLKEHIHHWAIFSEKRKKIDTLRSFLVAAKPRKTLVFTARAGDVGNILSRLQYHHVAASALFGGMDKKNRKQALDDFRKDRVTVLISSDVAARGLDIAGISHIIALDVPQDGDAYIHRAGRTGRMGKTGIMLTIGDADEMRALVKLEKKLGIAIYPKELWGGKVLAPEG
jgi:superfamily II DNA/RNA helicase